MIPYGRQNINEADIQAVVDVLRSDLLTQGSSVPAFEKGVADYCGVRHAVAVNIKYRCRFIVINLTMLVRDAVGQTELRGAEGKAPHTSSSLSHVLIAEALPTDSLLWLFHTTLALYESVPSPRPTSRCFL